ncbi:hypothetical protein FGG08_004984 [Glutinoglossum americanum]|uniref:Gelsolin repeat protein n=1 Tax=Glutinoglossum americanum TaxID=1670608 RepID=A0A9P8HZD4_9PEZI|nr:hypothetical protein FGG08_004984 [Glutinoglossum americanum]
MSGTAIPESEDVNDFLQRIRELGDKRDKEDEERTKKLEEEILQGRAERQARRAERARSLSPTKDSPSNTPQSLRSLVMDTPKLEALVTPQETMLSSRDSRRIREAAVSDALEQLTGGSSLKGDAKASGDPKLREVALNDTFEQLTGVPRPKSDVRPEVNDASERYTGESPLVKDARSNARTSDLSELSRGRDSRSQPSPSAAIAPSRGSPLSWQRRPNSQALNGPRSRPLSQAAVENSPAELSRAMPEPQHTEDSGLSRSQIAQSLGSKDPSWFRQTADRGASSPAYRKNPDDPLPDTSLATTRMRLPGLSRESTVEPDDSASLAGSYRSGSPSRASSIRETGGWRKPYSTNSSLSGIETRSPLPTSSAQRFDPPTYDSSSYSSGTQDDQSGIGRIPAMSPSQGRISPERLERAASPTKGLGGFVQSAMLKRSDSVNKRWAAQPNTGPSRGNSIASNRGVHGGSGGDSAGLSGPVSHSKNEPQLNNNAPGSSAAIEERPGSSHSGVTITPGPNENRKPPIKGGSASPSNDELANVTLPGNDRTQTITGGDPEKTPPTSPSKTMDPRRWSPTKASWLESALNKDPEKPKPKAPPPQQPSWMAEINKAKAQRAAMDINRTGSFKEISTDGLMRPPPPGGPSNSRIGGPLSGFSSSTGTRSGLESSSDQIDSLRAKSPSARPKPYGLSPKAPSSTVKSPASSPDSRKSGETVQSVEKEQLGERSPLSEGRVFNESVKSTPLAGNSKPSLPFKNDAISAKPNLKYRQAANVNNDNDELEFKNVFGRLKSTKTQNFVAPDELKNNILRGKAGLNVTGGPKKTERKDEFKESILKKKEEMKAKARDEPGVDLIRPSSTTSFEKEKGSTIPEAIAKKKSLYRSTTGSSGDEMGKNPATPGAILKQKSLRAGQTNPSNRQQSVPSGPAMGGKLANRINPGLASLLAKSPSPPIGANTRSGASSPPPSRVDPEEGSEKKGNAPPTAQLSHATKGRARGPKRRLPTSKTQDLHSSEVSIPSDLSIQENYQNSKPETTAKSMPASLPETPRVITPKAVAPISPKPTIGDKAASRKPASEPPLDQSPTLIESGEGPSVSVKDAASLWGRAPNSLPSPETPRSKSPVKLPTKADEESAAINAGFVPKRFEKPIGLGLQSAKPYPSVHEPLDRNLPSPPMKSQETTPIKQTPSPKVPQKPSSLFILDSGTAKPAPASAVEPPGSPIPHTSEASYLFADFFDVAGAIPMQLKKVEVDTQALLSTMAEDGDLSKIKTLRKQICEITGDGKQKPIASHQEHILFEESMYLCTHVFGASSGIRTTEVYLWVGDGVSESSAQDAQLFSRNTANENKAKFITFKQGRETSSFFQALGGIVITRRGSSSRADSRMPYMLCGRRHLGQIAFDEVDLSVDSLCSGFPYLVTALSGKLYLWKGKGSGADELGCARLIGMDLGLTGEIEEVEEGHETPSFLSVFGSTPGKPPKSADHWRLKPSYDKYRTRLFCIDHGIRAKVLEVSPFCQTDLDQNHIYCVDAFFEIYIVVGAKSQTKYAEFQTALVFAQEYGILAASMEDRPFIPVSTVVLQGIPRDFKAVFRKWEEAKIMTSWEPKRKPSLRVVPLSAAIEATRRT